MAKSSLRRQEALRRCYCSKDSSTAVRPLKTRIERLQGLFSLQRILGGINRGSAGSSLYSGLKTGYEQLTVDSHDKEKIMFLKFGHLESRSFQGAETSLPILLLGYEIGFQIWLLLDTVKEIVSRRDHKIRCMDPVPLPNEDDQARCSFLEDWPLVAAVVDAGSQEEAAEMSQQSLDLPVSQVKLYSLKRHTYIHTISIPGRVLSVSCNRRALILAMSGQIMAYDIATLTVSYSAITQPAPTLHTTEEEARSVPLALGARWLAHASNQAVQSASGIAVGQRVANGSRGSPAGSNMEAVQHYAGLAAKSSGKHIKSLGEAGYKYFSSQVDSWRSNHSVAPSSPSSSSTAQPDDADVAGTVIVRDIVDRSTLAHFRAHTSPLLLLQFDASGTLLVTASVHGHTVNIYHLAAPSKRGEVGSAVHLFRLCRGMTPAVIQGVAFSRSGQWLCVSSARGTSHMFKLSLSDKADEPPPHLAAAAIRESERRDWKPAKLNAVGRARPASAFGTAIPGSAAASAAVNLYSGNQGTSLIASIFAPRVDSPESSPKAKTPEASELDEDLLIILQSGLLTRHRCALTQQLPHGSAEANGPVSPKKLQNGKRLEHSPPELVVQAVEHFDVCRKRSWPEREDFEGRGDSSPDEAEEYHSQPWSAYAETSLPSSGSQPLWADTQFHILEMQTGPNQDGTEKAESLNKEPAVILQVEEVPTKRISMQSRGGLAPVIIEGAETAVLRGANFHASQGYPHDPLTR